MTIIEAIKSGRRFRRKGAKEWYYVDTDLDDEDAVVCFKDGDEDSSVPMYVPELLADDWEVEEEQVSITRGKLERALDRVFGESPYPYKFREMLAKELGFHD